ncbi:Transcription initiation factor TFIID subunit 5 [Vitis vinifera]|uniref:Transcription initiation factor TFIID subunit 5 n=1 Tax=Vitis vinifera TaxID=29760 RepID=A0A438FZ99_VITVI|nr:Transcription initiation factor TFIID subunit 5 [Vitis vinifera]
MFRRHPVWTSFTPCIPDLLMAKDFKASVLHVSRLSLALPWIPKNSPQSLIALLLEGSLEERLEKAGGLLSDSEKAEGEVKETDTEENKKRSAEGGKQGSSIKKLKKDKVVGAAGKTARPEANAVSMAPRVKPELALPVMYFPNPCFILSPSIYILMAYGCTLLMLLELMRIRNQVVEVLT